jgi:GT2 family glycosyltransferase
MKILVASPTYDGMEYCFNEFIDCLKKIDRPDFKILIVDNSRSKGFFRKANKIRGIKVIYDDTKEEKNMARLASSRNKILDYAAEKNFDYLLMTDSDVMVPENALTKLLAHNKDVVSGLYFNIFKSDGKPKVLPVCYKEVEEIVFEKMKAENMLPSFVKSRVDLRRNITNEEMENGLLEVLIPSGGCLLLSRKAFISGARYSILGPDESYGFESSDDIYFFKELKKRGFELHCDPKLICGHNLSGKYRDGINPFDNVK